MLPPLTAPAAFSLDAILPAPFVDDLVAAPQGDALAWTLHERGARNFVAWKDGVTRKITHSRVDDGEELDGVQFVPAATSDRRIVRR